MGQRAASVFLNVPFDAGYERFFVALVASIVSVGRTPRCVLELPEHGAGRLSRLITHLRACSLSVHDLSRVGSPARFNMPFELGVAVATAAHGRSHHYMLLERQSDRLDRTLSDMKGRDPLIYGSSVKLLIASVVGALQPRTGATVDPLVVYRVFTDLCANAPRLKRRHSTSTLFTRPVFRDLVAAATIFAEKRRLL